MQQRLQGKWLWQGPVPAPSLQMEFSPGAEACGWGALRVSPVEGASCRSRVAGSGQGSVTVKACGELWEGPPTPCTAAPNCVPEDWSPSRLSVLVNKAPSSQPERQPPASEWASVFLLSASRGPWGHQGKPWEWQPGVHAKLVLLKWCSPGHLCELAGHWFHPPVPGPGPRHTGSESPQV